MVSRWWPCPQHAPLQGALTRSPEALAGLQHRIQASLVPSRGISEWISESTHDESQSSGFAQSASGSIMMLGRLDAFRFYEMDQNGSKWIDIVFFFDFLCLTFYVHRRRHGTTRTTMRFARWRSCPKTGCSSPQWRLSLMASPREASFT